MSDISECLLWYPDGYENRNPGNPITRDKLMPGRMFQLYSSDVRRQLVDFVSRQPAEWFVRFLVAKTEDELRRRRHRVSSVRLGP